MHHLRQLPGKTSLKTGDLSLLSIPFAGHIGNAEMKFKNKTYGAASLLQGHRVKAHFSCDKQT